jgi:hypothetical protein
LPDSKPTHPLAAYAGTYSDPFYGTVEVKVVDGKLRVMAAKNLWGDLRHRHIDSFMATWNQTWRGEGLVSFQLNPMTGEIVGLTSGGQTFRRQTR